jgi:exopolysaccharide biosynthesis polyprenyl glycosylphosphotransferase
MSTMSKDKVDQPRQIVAINKRVPRWQRVYSFRLVVTDIIALVWAVGGGNIVIYDARANWVTFDIAGRTYEIGYVGITIAIIAIWLLLLAVFGTRRYRVVGAGPAEYKSVIQSGATILVALVLLDFVLDSNLSRGYAFLVAIAGTLAVLFTRMVWRFWLKARRSVGLYSQRVVIVGSRETAKLLAGDLGRNYQAGYWIVGACVADGRPGDRLEGTEVPIYGDVDTVSHAIERSGADTVLIAGGHRMTPAEVRNLSWSLEPGRQHLIVSPSLTDIAGPRIHSRPVAGLPLIHVETPRYEGVDRYLKRGFDVIGSVILLLVLSPLLITVSILIATSSRGNIFFSHERIGKDGKPFQMMKFRSMVPNADAMLADLLAKQGTSEKPLFKVENDPRITPIGRFIRKYSIDEIPQLINVLRGDMSLVGPRPQVAKEVALYDHAAARRLYVQPGMTGLWQVSGRSNLGWEESVRLDLYYVENWSLAADLGILWRTLRAVLASDGAV